MLDTLDVFCLLVGRAAVYLGTFTIVGFLSFMAVIYGLAIAQTCWDMACDNVRSVHRRISNWWGGRSDG